MATVELLRQHPLLGRLTTDQLLRFQLLGDLELFQPGEDIVVEGTLGDALYLILSGTATVMSASGVRPLATLLPGEFFGEMSLVEPAPRSATVRALEPTEVFRVPHRQLIALLEKEPKLLGVVLVTIVRVLSHRLRKTNELVGSVESLSDWLAGSLV